MCGPAPTTLTTFTLVVTHPPTTSTEQNIPTPSDRLTAQPHETSLSSSQNPPSFCEAPLCQCPQPDLSFICLPCDELLNLTDTCIQMMDADNPGCSIASISQDVSIDILHCGWNQNVDFNIFGRTFDDVCVQDGRVPPMTVVHTNCWGVTSGVFRCHADGYWKL